MTDATRWARVEQIFHTVADLPAGQARDAMVSDLCAHDPTLAVEVRALLEEDASLRAAEAPPIRTWACGWGTTRWMR